MFCLTVVLILHFFALIDNKKSNFEKSSKQQLSSYEYSSIA